MIKYINKFENFSFVFKKCAKFQKGFTLIEVILSVAILAMVTTSLLMMFTNGVGNIFGAGKKSVSHYVAQDQIESKVSDTVGLPISTIELKFSGNAVQYNVEGKKVDVNYTYGMKTKKLTTFTTK